MGIIILLGLCQYSYAKTVEIIIHQSNLNISYLVEEKANDVLKIVNYRAVNFQQQNPSAISKLVVQQSKVGVIQVESSLTPTEICDQLEAFPGIDEAEPNYPLELYQTVFDPLSNKQTYLRENDLFQIWSLTAKKDVIVAVIDTGIDLHHRDLSQAIYTNPNEIINGKDDDGNGYADDVHGYQWLNWLGNKVSNKPVDDHGHGTLISGIIAGSNNQHGIVGVHPQATILPLKVFDSNGVGNQLEAAMAIYYAINQGAALINCSWGFHYKTKVLEDAINEALAKGIIVVAAVGNQGEKQVMYPANFDRVVGVGSLNDDTKDLALFSNFGKNLDIAISGIKIFSSSLNNSYEYITGTSASAAIISGLLARVMSFYPSLPAESYIDLVSRTSYLVSDKQIKTPNIYRLLDGFDMKPTISESTYNNSLVTQINMLENVMIAPNPVINNEANLFFTISQAGLAGNINIYNLEGLLIKNQSFITQQNQNKITINVDDVQNGNYLYVVSVPEVNKIIKGKFSILK